MKQISCFFLLSISLASCANVESPAPTVTVTFTSVPSSTPTTPTAIPATPTMTEDPLKNSPEGTTGFDKVTGEPIREVTYEKRANI